MYIDIIWQWKASQTDKRLTLCRTQMSFRNTAFINITLPDFPNVIEILTIKSVGRLYIPVTPTVNKLEMVATIHLNMLLMYSPVA